MNQSENLPLKNERNYSLTSLQALFALEDAMVSTLRGKVEICIHRYHARH